MTKAVCFYRSIFVSLCALCVVFVNGAWAFSSLPSGYEELNRPLSSFISPAEYNIAITLSRESKGVPGFYRQFLDALGELDYKAAEKSLLAEKTQRVSALNLALLYHYLDSSDVGERYFEAWRKVVSEADKVNFLQLLKVKHMKRALAFCENLWKDETLTHYNRYLLAQASNDLPAMRKALRAWSQSEKSEQLRQLAELSERIGSTNGVVSDKDFDRISDQKFRALIKGLYYQDQAKLQSTIDLWLGMVTKKDNSVFYSRDVYSRLIALLIQKKKWKDLEAYLDNPPIFLLDSMPRIQATINARKRKQTLRSNVLRIKIIEERVEPKIPDPRIDPLKDNTETKP